MEKIKIEREAILLDKDELDKLYQCLKYCKHRLVEHSESGLEKAGVPVKFIDYLLKVL